MEEAEGTPRRGPRGGLTCAGGGLLRSSLFPLLPLLWERAVLRDVRSCLRCVGSSLCRALGLLGAPSACARLPRGAQRGAAQTPPHLATAPVVSSRGSPSKQVSLTIACWLPFRKSFYHGKFQKVSRSGDNDIKHLK